MAIGDIPVFREARRGQVVRSDDWNAVQRELRNGIRTHRHTRVASARLNDGTTDDLALQITTDEIADGAVTQAKLGSGVFESLVAATRSGTDGKPVDGDGSGALHTVTTNTLALAPLGREQVQHGLGRVPVAVTVAIRQRVTGLTGDFELYGAALERDGVVAAVPVEPDGTFTLVSTSNEKLSVRWWAIAGNTASVRTVAARAPQGAAQRAPRRSRAATSRQE